MALFLSRLSPAGSWLDRRPEALSAPRIIRVSVSVLRSAAWETGTPGDAQVRKVGGLKKVRNWVTLGPRDAQ
jgi:hypothetical protein